MTLFLKFFPTSTPAKCLCPMRISGSALGVSLGSQTSLVSLSEVCWHCRFLPIALCWVCSLCLSRAAPHPPQPCTVSHNAHLYEMHHPGYFALASGQVQPMESTAGRGWRSLRAGCLFPAPSLQ